MNMNKEQFILFLEKNPVVIKSLVLTKLYRSKANWALMIKTICLRKNNQVFIHSSYLLDKLMLGYDHVIARFDHESMVILEKLRREK